MTDVTDRRGRIGPVGNGPKPGHLQPKTLAPAAFAALALFSLASPAKSDVSEFVVPEGPLIALQDGRIIDGHITRIDQTDMVIQTDDGATEILPRATVDRVTFETVTGRELTGELVGWTPGVYQIATPEAAIKVYSTIPAVPAAIAVAAPSEGQGVQAEDAGEGNGQAIAAVEVDAAAEGQDAAVTPTADLSIQVSVENSKENGPPVAFNIELSKASENSVVLIYATIDGTAVNGQDYEANRGVVVMKPGERVARIEAAVLDDSEREDQEHLQLFLTVDPKVAVVENQHIVATIDDDDQG